MLWVHKKNAKGLSPLKIRVTINRKTTYFSTSYYLAVNQWKDDKIVNYPNEKIINVALRKKISDIEKDISLRQIEGRTITAKSLRGNINDRSFEKFAAEVRKDQKEINRIDEFASGIMLSEMNVQFLRKYQTHELERGMAPNTVNTTFKYLRRIIRQAYAEKIITENPFDQFKVPKYVNPEKIFLSLDDIDKIESWVSKKNTPAHLRLTAIYFLFGCYTGLRFSDWELFDLEKNIQNGRIMLRAKKNKSFVSIKIFPRLQSVLNKMKGIDKPYSGQKTNFFLKEVATLTKVKKNLTCHVSRHTNATLLATMGVRSDVVAELLGISLRTVSIYYKITGADTDKETEILQKF